MADHSTMKLGRKPSAMEPRRMAAASKLLELLPPPPPAVDWMNGCGEWGMMLNDNLGDCTAAAAGHTVQIVTGNVGFFAEETPADSDVLDLYEKTSGYNPADPNTDNGAYEPDVLNYWKTNGWVGHKLLGWVSPDPKNLPEVMNSIAHFGSVYIGVTLPMTAQKQDVWDVAANDGGVWGGHAVIAPAYNTSKREFTFITWGQNKLATFDWWQKYVDECHVLLLDTWLQHYPADTQANVMALLADMAVAQP